MQPLLACLLPSVGASSVVGVFASRQLNVSSLCVQLDHIPTALCLLADRRSGGLVGGLDATVAVQADSIGEGVWVVRGKRVVRCFV